MQWVEWVESDWDGGRIVRFISLIQGAITQEVIDLLSIRELMRMILPTGSLSDFRLPLSYQQNTAAAADPMDGEHE